jgi:hypothetical protein
MKFDLIGRIPLTRGQCKLFRRTPAEEIRQVNPVVCRQRLVSENHEGITSMAFGDEPFAQLVARHAVADNDETFCSV